MTYSYHHPLSDYITWLAKYGIAVIGMEEWCSDKKSEGARAKWNPERPSASFGKRMTAIAAIIAGLPLCEQRLASSPAAGGASRYHADR